MTDLPEGWEWAAIEDVLAPLEDGRLIHQGWSPRCDKGPADTDEWGVLKTTAVQPGAFLAQHNKRLPDALEPRPGIEVMTGDLLLTCAGPRSRCGVACLVRQTRPRLMLSGKIYRFRAAEPVMDRRFLEAYLLSARAWTDIDAMKTGGSDSGLNLTHARFRRLALPVPPLREQEQIVAAIEEHLSRLDAAKVALVSADRRTELLRGQALRTLLQQDSRWPLAGMRSLAQLSLGKMLDGRKQTGLHPTPYLRNINVRWGAFDMNDLATMDISPREFERVTVIDGDVVMCEGGEPGRCSVWRGAKPIAIQKALHRIRPNADIDGSYLALVFRQLADGGELAKQFTGTTIKHLPKEKLAEIQIHVPPIAVQRAAVARAHTFLDGLAQSVTAVRAAQRRNDALRRSILAAAFAGKLVPQDPSDEPASVLLERIRAERAAAPPTKRKRKVSP